MRAVLFLGLIALAVFGVKINAENAGRSYILYKHNGLYKTKIFYNSYHINKTVRELKNQGCRIIKIVKFNKANSVVKRQKKYPQVGIKKN